MAETMQSLDQLATLKPAAPEAPKYVQKLDVGAMNRKNRRSA